MSIMRENSYFLRDFYYHSGKPINYL